MRLARREQPVPDGTSVPRVTFTSKASSPEKLIRASRTGTPPRSVSCQVMKPNAAAEASISGKTAVITSRERGPATGNVAQWSVTEVRCTRRSGHSVCSHSSIQSGTVAAPPVVVETRKRSSASRITVPSSSTIPSARHSSP